MDDKLFVFINPKVFNPSEQSKCVSGYVGKKERNTYVSLLVNDMIIMEAEVAICPHKGL